MWLNFNQNLESASVDLDSMFSVFYNPIPLIPLS